MEEPVQGANTTSAEAQDDVRRRRYARHEMEAEVTVSSDTNFFVGLSENVSEGGLFVATWSPPPVGARVSMQVAMPWGESVRVEGTVRWHRHDEDGTMTGCGIQFVELDADSGARIRAVVEVLAREPMLYDA